MVVAGMVAMRMAAMGAAGMGIEATGMADPLAALAHGLAESWAMEMRVE